MDTQLRDPIRIYLDDERPLPREFTHLVKTSQEAINLLTSLRLARTEVELFSFDHDLGGWREGEDYDDSKRVLRWMILNSYWPRTLRFHTANPIAHKWLRLLARDEAPEGVVVDETDPWQFGGRY
jgi:hypothetical protein